jgi:hypothetical protein
MIILRRVFKKPYWMLNCKQKQSIVFQLRESNGIYYWIRADMELQDEDVPVLKLSDNVVEEICTIYNKGFYSDGRYAFLAKDEHFE